MKKYVESFITLVIAIMFAGECMMAESEVSENPLPKRTEHGVWPPPVDNPADPLLDGEPVLMALSETSVNVTWAVGTWATGGVQVSEKQDMSDARFFPCHAFSGRVMLSDRVLSARITGLKPGTRYYYRTYSVREQFDQRSYNLSAMCDEYGTVHSFTTYGAKDATGKFAVMNDTHMIADTLAALQKSVDTFEPEVTIWNGDAVGGPEWRECVVDAILTPKGLTPDYASDRPIEFVMGNHERFGSWGSLHIDEILPKRLAAERSARDEALEWSHAFRQGPIAFICLDTAGDRGDSEKGPLGYGAVRDFIPYRKAQAKWLEDQFKRAEIASAPYVVALCHIPLVWENEKGDNGATWLRECGDEWGKIFNRYGVQIVISGHTHGWRHFPACEGRNWDQLIGGGPYISKTGATSTATLTTGEIKDGKLIVTLSDAGNGNELKRLEIAPRTAAMRGGERDSLKVLMIGNSFSISNFRQMPQVAQSMGKKLLLGSLCIGGCSIERHWNNVCAPDTKPYSVDISDGRHFNGNIPDVLVMEDWDIVTIQQASPDSWRPETYEPYGSQLIEAIRKICPKAEIVLQETWSYTPEDKRLAEWGITPREMYEKLHAACGDFAKRHDLRVIPTGTAVEKFRSLLPVDKWEKDVVGDPIGSDRCHLNVQGRYMQALVWTKALFGVDPRQCPYVPDFPQLPNEEFVTFGERAKVIKEAAAEASF